MNSHPSRPRRRDDGPSGAGAPDEDDTVSAEANPTRVLIVDGDGDEAALIEACLRDGLQEPDLVVRHVASTAAAHGSRPHRTTSSSSASAPATKGPSLSSRPSGSAARRSRPSSSPAARMPTPPSWALRAGAFEVLVKPSLTPTSLAATVRYCPVQLEESRRKETAAEQALRRAERQTSRGARRLIVGHRLDHRR